MAAPDYMSMLFKNRLHLVGRPQMSPSQRSLVATEPTVS